MSGINIEVVLAGGYALLMLAVAIGLDLVAQTTHRRAQKYRTSGFTYDGDHDHWVCPEGEHLWPHEYDHERRQVRYRAKAHVCNGCPVKDRCTDSERGREVVAAMDPWPHSEAGRFHRVIALVPVVLAALMLVVAGVRHLDQIDLAVLVVPVCLTALTARWLQGDLRATPANFPAPTPSQGLRLHRRGSSRTRWGWDR